MSTLSPVVADPNALAWANRLPELDDLQLGSLRRMLNLAGQLPDDWSGMMGPTTMQEDFGGLRFQLAYMSYALALAHVHRLPAAPGLFKQPFEQLIEKMLSPDVWSYWHYVSTGNGPINRAQGELPAQWNPVGNDNIMYSAYIQSMALMYHYIFRDDRYARQGALTFAVKAMFWGDGSLRFPYDERSLSEHLYWGMVERGFLGIACEPNCVFQICNQPPILGFRMHDLVYGTDRADEVMQGYERAWEDFGILTEDGHFNMMVMEQERVVVTPPEAPWVDFWLAALMHAWKPELVEERFPDHIARWGIAAPHDTLWVPPTVQYKIDMSPLVSARDHGWAAVAASEVGDDQALARLLGYADRFLNPVREKGAYYYPRHDAPTDAEGRMSVMDPHTGNVLLGYARLNVKGGLRKLFEGPLTDAHFAAPALAALSPGIDVRRAIYDAERRMLALTLQPIEGPVDATLAFDNALVGGMPAIVHDANDEMRSDVDGDRLELRLTIARGTTLVLSW
ncbi:MULTISPECIES: linalool dehydratase/isomerase domain-containing protein [unclassified Sphingomonas]|uniref:linalool dehydratase/isomerase domain-containing protein n=1 Tax=unclassified Sphingomonas TaxID=196159 RepID=UPI0006F3215C|nr:MULTISPECIES: hypothetical protein [unclassified Sphingomonas]KQX23404.1 hypothetical protein ASD17_03625 [Sphingomonas sp. Root1294]KQY68255.1 hypothetical protein ASD39_06145 [Sphingomonas sp. Root50]KRB91153.1 hypothetical protein ASE22_12950 [Sphingomonas sp. Root720]